MPPTVRLLPCFPSQTRRYAMSLRPLRSPKAPSSANAPSAVPPGTRSKERLMITVGDVMNMRAFDSIWLATPCDGAAAARGHGRGHPRSRAVHGRLRGVHLRANSCSPRLGFAGDAPRSGRRGAACAHRVRRGGGGREARGAEGAAAHRWCRPRLRGACPCSSTRGAIWNGSSPTS